MKPVQFAFALVLAAAVTAPVAAMPPPLVLSVVPIVAANTPEGLLAQGQAIIDRQVNQEGVFSQAPSTLDPAALTACGAAGDAAAIEACVRVLTIPTKGKGTYNVVALFEAAPGGKVKISCIGAGEAMKRPDWQIVTIDPQAALNGPVDFSQPDRHAAQGCFTGGAGETW